MKTKTTPKSNASAFSVTYMKKHLDAVMYHLCFGVSCPPGVKGTKVNNGKIPFVQKALEVSMKHPELIPGYAGLPEFMKSKQAEHDLRIFASEAKEVVEIIVDHNGTLSYIAYVYALAFFENVRKSAKNNIAGALPVYKMLLREFGSEIPASYIQKLAA